MQLNQAQRIALYVLTFIVGMWGGELLIRQFSQDTATQVQSLLGQPAADFCLPDLEGSEHCVDEWAGKVRVINFWATWCPPCQRETPLFVELQETYGARGLQFIGVAIDDADKVRDFIDTHGVEYPMLIGQDEAIAAAKRYGNRYGALPYTVIVDRENRIRHIVHGELSRNEARTEILPLL